MAAPLGNQYAKGHEGSGAGRKGYEFEREQLEQMRRMLTKYLKIVEKVLDGDSDNKDYSILMAISVDLRKILDKLHASKEEMSGEIIEKVIYVYKD